MFEMVCCPYEPKNFILKSKLDEHLKTCPKRLEIESIRAKPWFKEGINFMNPQFKSSFDLTVEERDAAALSKLDPEIVEEITNKINKLYDKLKALDDKSTSDLFRVSEIVDKWGSDQMLKPELKHTN